MRTEDKEPCWKKYEGDRLTQISERRAGLKRISIGNEKIFFEK